MTREEAREELIEEWNEFIDGCGLRGIEEKEAKRNPDFKKVYEANLMAIQALSQEPSGDAISRQAVLDLCDKSTKYDIPYEYYEGKKHIRGWDIGKIINMTKLMQLPSVKPQEKTGHWINAKVGKLFPSNDFKCSECGNILDFNGVNCGRGDANYCPNCGAKMVEEQERSDKE